MNCDSGELVAGLLARGCEVDTHLSIPIETPDKVRGGCSRMTELSPPAKVGPVDRRGRTALELGMFNQVKHTAFRKSTA